MSKQLHIWGHGTARTLRVYWALQELRLDYVRHSVRTRTEDMDDESFLAISPGKKIPAVTYGKMKLTESGAILEFLYRLSGSASQDTTYVVEIERWSCFALMELDATALYVLRRHEDLFEIYGKAPAACTAARDYFRRQIEVVDKHLGDERAFVVGDSLSKADIILGTCCFWAVLCGLELPYFVNNWYRRVSSRNQYKKATEANA